MNWNHVAKSLPIHEQIIAVYIVGHIPEIAIYHDSTNDYLFLDKDMKQILGVQFWVELPEWPDNE